MEFVDKSLMCRECGSEFTFSAGEQEYFRSRGLENEPGRCPACRAARRKGLAIQAERQYYNAICNDCGSEAKIPFEPIEGRTVYCNDCFAKIRGTRL